VASTTGGFDYGIAKKVTLIAVKVLGCGGSGTWAGVVTGVEWVTSSYQARNKPSVANMSLGGGVTAIADTAVANSIAAGVNYAIAAGNNNADACNFSPARVPPAFTVGATTYALNPNPALPSTDSRATFSNVGTCVDIFAPGQNIKAAWIGSNTATSTISGTSMASPHVAGVVAVHLGHLLADNLPAESPAQVITYLRSVASPNRLANPGTGSPNLLLYSPFA
jgi:subtilisin family serine protease